MAERTLMDAFESYGEAKRKHKEYTQHADLVESAVGDIGAAIVEAGAWAGEVQTEKTQLEAGKKMLSSSDTYSVYEGGMFEKGGFLYEDKLYSSEQVRTLGQYQLQKGLGSNENMQKQIIKNWAKVTQGKETGGSDMINNIATDVEGDYKFGGNITLDNDYSKANFTGKIYEKGGKRYLEDKNGKFIEVTGQDTIDELNKQLGKQRGRWSEIFDISKIFGKKEIDVKVGTGGSTESYKDI